jgi:hypothetical protein
MMEVEIPGTIWFRGNPLFKTIVAYGWKEIRSVEYLISYPDFIEEIA